MSARLPPTGQDEGAERPGRRPSSSASSIGTKEVANSHQELFQHLELAWGLGTHATPVVSLLVPVEQSFSMWYSARYRYSGTLVVHDLCAKPCKRTLKRCLYLYINTL